MSMSLFVMKDAMSPTSLRGVPVHHQPYEAQNGERPQ